MPEPNLEERFAVLLIDMQKKFLENINPLETKVQINSQIEVLDCCAQYDIPLVIIEYNGCGLTIKKLMKKAKKVQRQKSIIKSAANAFTKPELAIQLEEWNPTSICFMGVYASGCVWQTAGEAADKGYKIYSASPLIADPDSAMTLAGVELFTEKGVYYDDYLDLLKLMRR
jgi:nicotinamidase-related amidase